MNFSHLKNLNFKAILVCLLAFIILSIVGVGIYILYPQNLMQEQNQENSNPLQEITQENLKENENNSQISELSQKIKQELLKQQELAKQEFEEITLPNESNKTQNKNVKNYDNLTEFKANEEDLEYLFKDSKFPVDDYLWNGGFKKPSQNVGEAFAKANQEQQSLETIRKLQEQKAKDDEFREQLEQELQKSKESNQESNNNLQEQITTLQKELEEQKKINELNKTNQYNPNSNPQPQRSNPNINALIRSSILSDRGGININFSSPNQRYGVDSFSNQQNVDEATNEHRLYRTLRAGRLIPATLTTAISSDIEGLVTAQVEQDIYAAMGRAVLIPRGSKVIGFYQNDNKLGQDRLAITWREIITPQGVNILLTNAIASDNLGIAGAKGEVNNKYFERYGIAYGLSTLSNMLLLTLSTRSGNNVYTNEIYNQSSNDLSTIVQDIIQQQSQIKPTIEIKQGSRIYITPTAHIWFPKPKNNEVLAQFFTD